MDGNLGVPQLGNTRIEQPSILDRVDRWSIQCTAIAGFFVQGRNVCDELLQRRGWFENQEALVGGGEGAAQGSGAG